MQKVSKFKLGIVLTHPVQYYDPVFSLMNERGNIDIHVFYTAYQGSSKFDPGFQKQINWDIPMLEGYPYTIVENKSASPGSHHFKGADNPELIPLIEKYKPDAVLVYGWAYKSHLQLLRYFSGKVQVWFRGDSTLLDQTSWLKALLRSFLLKWVYSYVEKAFYVGSSNKAYFLKYGLSESQLVFAPHAIDNQRFAEKRPAEAQNLRDELKVPREDILILFSGKFEDKKSPLELLKTFKMIDKPGTHLLFAGSGVLENEMRKEAITHPRIYFRDFVNQTHIPVYYQACDLFCLPSKGPAETWGLSVNEAMAAGKAVLVSDKAGCAIDLVKNGENGKIFSSNLKEALSELLLDKERLRHMGEVSSEIIHKFSFLNQVIALEKECHA